MRIDVSVIGIDDLNKKIIAKTNQEAMRNADRITETYARKMANESAAEAPVDSGDLRASIAASPRKYKLGVWEYGSDLTYARKQEYENISHKGFIRKSVWNNQTPYRNAIRKEFSRWD